MNRTTVVSIAALGFALRAAPAAACDLQTLARVDQGLQRLLDSLEPLRGSPFQRFDIDIAKRGLAAEHAQKTRDCRGDRPDAATLAREQEAIAAAKRNLAQVPGVAQDVPAPERFELERRLPPAPPPKGSAAAASSSLVEARRRARSGEGVR